MKLKHQQYEKIKTIKQIPGLFLGSYVLTKWLCISMDKQLFYSLEIEKLSLSPEKAEKLVRKDCNDFLKTKQGFHYLTMKYPNLSVPQAINEYIKEALWIDSII